MQWLVAFTPSETSSRISQQMVPSRTCCNRLPVPRIAPPATSSNPAVGRANIPSKALPRPFNAPGNWRSRAPLSGSLTIPAAAVAQSEPSAPRPKTTPQVMPLSWLCTPDTPSSCSLVQVPNVTSGALRNAVAAFPASSAVPFPTPSRKRTPPIAVPTAAPATPPTQPLAPPTTQAPLAAPAIPAVCAEIVTSLQRFAVSLRPLQAPLTRPAAPPSGAQRRLPTAAPPAAPAQPPKYPP
mmetsp:Transcript_84224/g.146256  ORF Transcript_84224/g.146256 Transcript_84224/m.146256 type:complete len:239 (-) Transcript_84224:1010-1726(-)